MTEQKLVKMWMPVIKNPDNPHKFLAILSDTSIDRDGESMSKELIESWASNGSLPALANHKNSMQTFIGGWENIRAVQKGENTALFAEPWFFTEKANPLAGQIKRQMEEALAKGLNPGISIGAIIYDSETRKMNGKDTNVYTKAELVEASWVPIQSNRNASFGHLAKGYNFHTKSKEESKVELTQKDIDSAVQKKAVEFSKELESKNAEITKLNETVKGLNEAAKKALEASETKVKEAQEATEKANKTAIEKQKFADTPSEQAKKAVDNTDETEKAIAKGYLPARLA